MTIRYTESQLDHAVSLIKQWITEATSAVVFTGAGISTESGIPDFRSPGGVWANNRTIYFDEFCRSADARHEYWRQKSAAHRDFVAAAPNVTHTTVAAWEVNGHIKGVITQNIDGLHTIAGNSHILELHGTARRVTCLECAWADDVDLWVDRFAQTNTVPECPECAAPIKHATISFGQPLPADTLQRAMAWSREADLFFAMGSSLVVEPAASLPRIAKHSGAKLVILNRDETPLDSLADLVVNAPLGAVFTKINAPDEPSPQATN